MNLLWAIVFLAAGVALLWKCADFLVGGAVAIAARLGVSSLVIGLTVVAMGTSAPEVAASIAAAIRGMGDIAVGNVYGSNIANLALVGGVAALIRPMTVRPSTLKREIPVMLAVALLLWPFLRNLHLSRLEAIVLLAVFAALISATIYSASRSRFEVVEQAAAQATGMKLMSPGKAVVFIAIGLAGLAVGADITVRGAVYIGRMVGLSEAVIGLTIVAIGTSLPEMATCIVASLKGHDDISVGNLVGSNIFNTLLVVGIAGIVKPFEITARLAGPDYWIMIGVSAGFGILLLLGRCVLRRPGAIVLVAAYAAYLVYLFSFSSGN
jgi:cation:H+ antiporter